MTASFKKKSYKTIEFVDSKTGKFIGELRVKPNAILWRNRDKEKYHFITLEDFMNYMSKISAMRTQ